MSRRFCLGCGRSFEAKDSRHPFCSIYCKRRYSNHKFFKCSDCRTPMCPVRNDNSLSAPEGCLNLKWDPYK